MNTHVRSSMYDSSVHIGNDVECELLIIFYIHQSKHVMNAPLDGSFKYTQHGFIDRSEN